MRRSIFLLYHELEVPDRPLNDADPGSVRYTVRAAAFKEQIGALRALSVRGLSVGEALADVGDTPCVAITFDDGCETDLVAAAPVLRDAGFNATFYVIVNRLGVDGFMSRDQLRKLAEFGFEIGSHGMTHRHLHDLPTDAVRAELVESKKELESITGRRVAHFSCPGGRWNERVLRLARDAGYDSVVTTTIGINSARTDRFRLSRVAVMRGMSAGEVGRLGLGKGMARRRAQNALLRLAKYALGNSRYERLRSLALARGGGLF